jgi:hypothetical protein
MVVVLLLLLQKSARLLVLRPIIEQCSARQDCKA